MTSDELRTDNANTLKKALRPLLLQMTQEKRESNIEWMIEEFGYGRSFFLPREGCQATCQKIIDIKDNDIEKDFYKYIYAFTDEYAFSTAALQASLELNKEFIDPDAGDKLKWI